MHILPNQNIDESDSLTL